MNPIEMAAVKVEIKRLERKGAIAQCDHEHGEFISSIFKRPKRDGGICTILNLKKM